MHSDNFIGYLRKQLHLPLPGKEAQYKMAHALRYDATVEPPANAQIACVLICFYLKNEEWHLVLIERVSHNQKDKHSGQMGFPGGRYEEVDKTLSVTALREAEEEVGIDSSTVEILGRLTEIYIPVSNFLVHPFVGYTSVAPSFTIQLSEVKNVIEVPFSLLQNPEIRQVTDMQIRKHLKLKNVPYFRVFDKVVWGATAMMLNELLEVSKDW
ncbi:MAG: CoA pyrophosphatase [Bacteroidetes bacterium]|nr:CoA pyrophosphatase [Bacteroidota bacterium]